MKLNVKKIVLSLAIMLSVFSFSLTAKASYSANVLTYWQHVTQITGTYPNTQISEYDTNQTYETIVYPNGYTYTETTKDITTIGDKLLGTQIVEHYRDYSVY
jgi:hypothetical protein